MISLQFYSANLCGELLSLTIEDLSGVPHLNVGTRPGATEALKADV